MKRLVTALVAVAAGCLVAGNVFAAAGGNRHTAPTYGKPVKVAAKAENWSVIQVGDEIRAVRTADIQAEKKRADETYKAAMKDYTAAKKKDPTTEKPVKLTVKILRKGFKSQQDAQDHVDKLMKEKPEPGAETAEQPEEPAKPVRRTVKPKPNPQDAGGF